ncbi:PH-like domain-containing protein [Glutamicibacter sp.]|jgi:hypothetical protein|uniref:PH-like domain-containing protein n=1 Tax=Glutamicibacter sp. TaxID=1931995 RepID=UPI002B468E00|nr:hypothetical protein [Glutamicibacter sp.]HJX79760.1 hypothetical protein [Glutamicibacter sp.]
MTSGELTSVLVTIGIAVLFCALILIGWRNMKRRQSAIPAPYAQFDDEPEHQFTGMYVATTRYEDWLDRIAVHQLGVRSNATLELGSAGVHLLRPGTTDLHIPWNAFVKVARSAGMVGKFVERDGLIVITWTKDDFTFDTGFRPRYHEDTAKIYQLLASHQADAAEQETN